MAAKPVTTFDFEKPIVEMEERIAELRGLAEPDKEQQAERAELEGKLEATKQAIYGNLTPWQQVQIARHLQRPHTMDYIDMMFTDFTEIHGDRLYGDDAACVAGFARFDGRPCAVLGQQKGRDVKENVFRNFGQMHPEGYRKAMRVMRLAEKFGRPIVIFIDTAGAFPGIGAEERGQAEAIARNIMEMSLLRVPVICTIIGEGGSGGALGIGVGDRVLMQHNAYYSVISPEGCASILWRDAKFAPQAAETLRITSAHLMELGIIDEIVPEPLGGAHRDPAAAVESLREAIRRSLAEVGAMETEEMLEARFQKFRKMGVFEEEPV